MFEEGNRKQKALLEDMKEEAAKKARIHEAAVPDRQKRDQLIVGYLKKAERCSRSFKVTKKERTSPEVVIDVI